MINDKALKVLGFRIKIASDFKLKLVVQTFFVHWSVLILEYGSIVWCPHTATDDCLIERVKRRLLRFARFLLDIPHIPHEYSCIVKRLELNTLFYRLIYLSTKFLQNLLDGKVDSPSLLALNKFKVP